MSHRTAGRQPGLDGISNTVHPLGVLLPPRLTGAPPCSGVSGFRPLPLHPSHVLRPLEILRSSDPSHRQPPVLLLLFLLTSAGAPRATALQGAAPGGQGGGAAQPDLAAGRRG